MADSAVSFVLGRLGDFVATEAKFLKGVGNDVVLLKDKLEWLQTFVQDADRKRRQGGNAYMDVWVQQTRHVSLEVEDVLDEFMLRVDVRQGLPVWKKWFKFLSSCAAQISVRHELSGNIAMIRSRLDQISEHRNAYIKDYTPPTPTSRSIPTIDGWDEEIEMVGFNKEHLSLEQLLLEGDRRRSIVRIVGERGAGKSTLVSAVYGASSVKQHFKTRARPKLLPFMREIDVLLLIYKEMCPFGRPASTIEEVHGALTEFLKERSYLIVLGNILKPFNWSSVLNSLPDNDLGNRVVIVNSPNDNEAVISGPSITVHPLKQADSYLLFRRHALVSGNQHHNKCFGTKGLSGSEYEKEMNRVCKDVFEITSGHPLSILLLGRLLRRKEFPDQWGYVLKHLTAMELSSRMEGILALCFDDLPHHLKSCFLYFAMKPENFGYRANSLVGLWTAEGFLRGKKGESMEDVGYYYLKELASRGMIHIVDKEHSTSSVTQRVIIHQQLHAMAQFEMQQGSFMDMYDTADVSSSTAVRHLYLQNLSASGYSDMKDASFPKLRSLICNCSEYWEIKSNGQPRSAVGPPYHNHFIRNLGRSKLLRVINLKGLQVKKLPDVVGSLINLRYLAITNTCLVELPLTIANLINLQTLDIQKSCVEKVTQAFWMIQTLRHVLASGMHLPKSVGALNNMQTLHGMVCAHPWHKNVSPLHNMINLRHLQISELTSDHWGALADAFKNLESLLELHLSGRDIPFTLFTKYSLQRLQHLELKGRIVMSSQETEERWTMLNLRKLVLTVTSVNQGFIDMIGKLPCLAALQLDKGSYAGEELVFSQESGFGNLTDLGIHFLPELSEWNIGLESLPKVEKITVINCTNMRLKLEGEQVLKNLKKFTVRDMPESWGVEEAGALSEKFTRINLINND